MSIGRMIHEVSKDGSLAEQYRKAGNRWAMLDGKARKLEEIKSAELAKRMKAVGGDKLAAAERDVKADQSWHDFLGEVTQARTSANEARVEMDYLHMRWTEQFGRFG